MERLKPSVKKDILEILPDEAGFEPWTALAFDGNQRGDRNGSKGFRGLCSMNGCERKAQFMREGSMGRHLAYCLGHIIQRIGDTNTGRLFPGFENVSTCRRAEMIEEIVSVV